MLNILATALVNFLILGLISWAIKSIVPMNGTVSNILNVLVTVIAIIYFISVLTQLFS